MAIRPRAVDKNALHTMRANRSEGTGPELALRSALRAAGLKGYRVNLKGVPGRPDVAFVRARLAIFVHGCFWHRCRLCNPPLPKRHARFWRDKLAANVERDERTRTRLEQLGWTTVEFWECEVMSAPRLCADRVHRWMAAWREG